MPRGLAVILRLLYSRGPLNLLNNEPWPLQDFVDTRGMEEIVASGGSGLFLKQACLQLLKMVS